MGDGHGASRVNGRPGKAGDLGDHDSAVHIHRILEGLPVPGWVHGRLSYEWLEGFTLVEQDSEQGLSDWLDTVEARDPDRARALRAALEQGRDDPGGEPGGEEPAPAPGPPKVDLGIIGTLTFASAHYPREWLIKRVLVKGKPGIIGGPKKALKTSFVVDLAVSLGAAVRFLDEFDVPRRSKTLVISGESGEATIQETMRRVCRAKGIDPAELEGQVFWGFTLPRLGSDEHLTALADFIRAHGIEVVLVDPLYLCLMSGGKRIDPANLFDVGPLLKTITDVCLGAGATPLLVHHFRKNREDPYASPDLEELAFSGVQEFARQWLLISRRERYEPGSGEHKLWLAVGGSDGHSGEWSVDVVEGVVDEDFRDREWRVTVAKASEAIGQAREQAAEAKVSRLVEQGKERDDARTRKIHDDAETALAALADAPGRAKTKTSWRDGLGWNSTRFNPVVELLRNQRRIRAVETVKFTRSDGRVRDLAGFEFVTNDLNLDDTDFPNTESVVKPQNPLGCQDFPKSESVTPPPASEPTSEPTPESIPESRSDYPDVPGRTRTLTKKSDLRPGQETPDDFRPDYPDDISLKGISSGVVRAEKSGLTGTANRNQEPPPRTENPTHKSPATYPGSIEPPGHDIQSGGDA